MDNRIKKFAEILINFSINVKPKEQVIIRGTEESAPLIKEIYRQLLQKGAYPVLRLSFSDMLEIFYRNAKRHHLEYLSDISMYEAKKSDAVIVIMSSPNTKSLTSVDSGKQAKHRLANKPLSDIIIKKDRWVLTLFPTQAYAQDAEMSLIEFEDFVYSALFVNKKDPVKEWNKLKSYQESVIKKLKRADKIRILSEDTDITLSVKGRTFINSCGFNNMPSGEVFTGPVENSAVGHIKFSFPACYSGKEVDSVYLEFEKGKIVKARADKNDNFLNTMLNMDKNARYLGEFAFGLNKGIKKYIKNILFDEKIGGTIHMAAGSSYPKTGGKNKSALHWDMIKDLRTTGEVYVDDKLFMKKGKIL